MSGAYEHNRAAFEFLETLAELVDQVDLDAERQALMRNPNKAHAARLYATAIRLWFGEHGTDFEENPDAQIIAQDFGL